MCDRIKKIDEEKKQGYDSEYLVAINNKYEES